MSEVFDDFGEPAEEVEVETAKQYLAATIFLEILLLTNSITPVMYWFFMLKPDMDADPAGKAVFERNWWWFGAGWYMVVWGMLGLYGFPAFIGLFFIWSGIKFFDKLFQFWMTVFVNYIGSIMHFFMLITFMAGSCWWVDNSIMTRETGWIITGSVVGWSVITFVWMGLTIEKSKRFMELRQCSPNCFAEEEEEFEDEFVELEDDAVEFHTEIWDF